MLIKGVVILIRIMHLQFIQPRLTLLLRSKTKLSLKAASSQAL